MDWRQIGKKLLFPPVWVLIILTVVSAVALALVFRTGLSETLVAYVSYVFSFYTLTVLCIFFSVIMPKRYKEIKAGLYANPLTNRYLTDAIFRTQVSLYGALGINLLYVGINVLSFALYRSYWFICLAVYYVILAVMRFLLAGYARVKGVGRDKLGELKRAVLCSYILLTVNFALSGAVMMILYQNKGYEYHGVLIYVMAAYTFYMTTHAMIDLIKYRKYKSPVMTMTKVIALSAALVSMLSLETAMFSQFGQEMSPEDQYLMIVLTGAGVSIAVVTMSIAMIVRSNREMRQLKETTQFEEKQ